ncbi:MAG: hypothetical protein M1822_005747 [Bathelium mastoideum]|nr:MAG: hypothetical protein M1822_005747 [Bathelium mastoideum]
MSNPTSIDSLPTELLVKVFAELQTSTFDLLNCMQCNKTWHELAQATLYRYIVLTSTNLSKFIEQCPASVNTDGRITILTLRLDNVACSADEDEDVDTATCEGSPAALNLYLALKSLGPRLANMDKLKALSVYRPSNRLPDYWHGSWISYSVLQSLVQNLPPTCISLELDVNTSKREKDVDLCSSIGKILPQLEYLRLRLPALCPKIWGRLSRADTKSSTALKGFPPDTAPHLKQCIVNTTLFDPKGPTTTSCYMPSDTMLWQQPSWLSLTEHIKVVVDREKVPVMEKLWIYSSVRQPTGDRTLYSTCVRHDVLSNQSLSIPVHDFAASIKDAWFVRLPGEVNTDFVTPLVGVNAVVEEYSWQQASTGVRLPAPLMTESGLESLPRASTKEQWRKRDRSACILWRNESIAERRLLNVEKGELMEEPAVREMNAGGMAQM